MRDRVEGGHGMRSMVGGWDERDRGRMLMLNYGVSRRGVGRRIFLEVGLDTVRGLRRKRISAKMGSSRWCGPARRTEKWIRFM